MLGYIVFFMKKVKRDNFTERTRLRLAQRVGYKCSFPKCNRATIGPVISDSDGINTVGRACHIEAASKGGPRFNPDMSSEDRKNIKNGIWCCNTHADIIDNDTKLFSVPTLKEWKQLAERYAYEAIDSSSMIEDKPFTLIQIGHDIVFRGIWSNINIETKEWTFTIEDFLYSDEIGLEKFIDRFTPDNSKNYVVVDTLGYGRLLKKNPVKETVGTTLYITFTFKEREEYSNPDNFIDGRLNFEDDKGPDLDLFTDGGWIKGKDAVIQNILIHLGTNQGQWWADENFGSFFFKYYKAFHKDHRVL